MSDGDSADETTGSTEPTPPAAESAAPAPAPTLSEPPDPVNPPPTRTFWTHLRQPYSVGFFLMLGALTALALGTTVVGLSTILILVASAFFIAVAVEPVVRRVERLLGSRTKAVLVVCVALVLLIVLLLVLVLPTAIRQIELFLADLPALIVRFEHSDLFIFIDTAYSNEVAALLDQLQAFVSQPGTIVAIGGGVLQAGITAVSALSGLAIVVVLSLYFMAALPSITESLVRLAPARSRLGIGAMVEQIIVSVGGYLNGMVILAAANAIVVLVLHLLLGLPFPIVMAVAALCITFIPLVGSLLFWASATILALFTNPTAAGVFLVVYFGYLQVEAYLLTPRVMSRTVAVPGSLVVIGALVGGTLLGLLGALVAIPVTASILLIIKQVVIPRQDLKT